MQAKNCPRCGKLFNEIKSPVCPACEKAEEDDFQRVREYIGENELSTLQEISEATGVRAKKIIQYIKDGRLEVTNGMNGEIVCESCATPLRRGRFCDKCLIALNRSVNSIFGKDGNYDTLSEERKNGKMYSSLMKKKL